MLLLSGIIAVELRRGQSGLLWLRSSGLLGGAGDLFVGAVVFGETQIAENVGASIRLAKRLQHLPVGLLLIRLGVGNMGLANGSDISRLESLLELLGGRADVGIHGEARDLNLGRSGLARRRVVLLENDKLAAVPKGNTDGSLEPHRCPGKGK